MTTDNATSGSIHVLINSISSQFEAIGCGETIGILAYARAGRHFDLRHTFVLPARRGRGVAGALVAAALDAIRSAGGTVTPSCNFVSGFLRDHPEYDDLRASTPVRPGPAPWTCGLPGITRESLGAVFDVEVEQIVTHRLRLRPWMLSDTDSAFSIFAAEVVDRWMRPTIGQVEDKPSMRRLLQRWIAQADQLRRPEGRWAVELVDSGALVGGVALLETTWSGTRRHLISGALATQAVGRGLAAEAGHAVIQSAFQLSETAAIHGLVHPANRRGAATFERIGMTRAPGVQHYRGLAMHLYGIERGHLERPRR
ncbi:GNAT family N-acetyltransferase [Kribbella pittospori]|uniref:GNAT family N-acetyltransferase n=1 Tax=Kribbella pittospori TaxID=722689 RepID=A0A4R0JMR3_9ACTN|nr:GNAT family N-acetyltransferase [Kribbella pittospori]TCC46158.1 GNAT family N-acetyltransferase [Kribbella pittospori]